MEEASIANTICKKDYMKDFDSQEPKDQARAMSLAFDDVWNMVYHLVYDFDDEAHRRQAVSILTVNLMPDVIQNRHEH